MASILNGGLNIPGNLNVFGDADVDGDVNIDGGLTVDGAVVVTGAITIPAVSILALTPQADAPTGAEGQLYADTDHKLYYHNGTSWQEVAFAGA